MRDEDLRGLRRLAEAQGDAVTWSRLAAALVRAELFDEASDALTRARGLGGADPSVEAAVASGLRGRARTEGDAASWSRVASALVAAGAWDEAGEALVRARAFGHADPDVEDALEAVSLEPAKVEHRSGGVTLGPTDRLGRWGSALAWSADSRRLFGATDGAIVAAREPAWELAPIVESDLAITALAVDLEGRFVVASRTPPRGFVSLLAVLDLETGAWARGKHVRASEGATLVTALACWHRTATVWAGDRARVSAYSRAGLELAGPVRAWTERERMSLAWNGDFARWPMTVADTRIPVVADGYAPLERPRLSFPTARAAERFREDAGLFRRIRTHASPLDAIAASPSGRFLALWNAVDRDVGLVDLATETTRRCPLEGLVRGGAWAPNGRRLVLALERGIAVVELGASAPVLPTP